MPTANSGKTTESGKLTFQPFDEGGVVRIYNNGFLPHWRQAGCTYFATWRLADSIPQGVLQQWKFEKRKWLEARDIDLSSPDWIESFKRLAKSEKDLYERHFVSKLFQQIDQGHGKCLFQDPSISKEVLSAIFYFHGQRLDVGDVVVMPNHVHALLTPYRGYELEDILHSIKSYSSNQIQRLLGGKGTLWMEETHDRIVRDGEELLRIQAYIRANPAKAKLSEGQFLLHKAEFDLKEL